MSVKIVKKNILLVDVDGKNPNLALMKLSTYFKNNGDFVTLRRLRLNYYETPKNRVLVNGQDFDSIYASIIFEVHKDCLYIINCNDVHIGGVGYNYDIKLPKEIDDLQEDYSIYPENNFSYGFITRGCIRNCYFCVVRKNEGNIYKYREPQDIIQHKKVFFMDNNILAYEKHKDILKWLVDNKINCQFNQALDIRLIDEENMLLLSQLRYINEYSFSFDDIGLEPIILDKLRLIKKYIAKDWKIRLFLYCNPSMDISSDVVYRIEFCKSNKVLPYLMRDQSCWKSKNKEFYIDLCGWCNQPNIIKKMTFKEFIIKRTNNQERIRKHINLYEKSGD